MFPFFLIWKKTLNADLPILDIIEVLDDLQVDQDGNVKVKELLAALLQLEKKDKVVP